MTSLKTTLSACLFCVLISQACQAPAPQAQPPTTNSPKKDSLYTRTICFCSYSDIDSQKVNNWYISEINRAAQMEMQGLLYDCFVNFDFIEIRKYTAEGKLTSNAMIQFYNSDKPNASGLIVAANNYHYAVELYKEAAISEKQPLYDGLSVVVGQKNVKKIEKELANFSDWQTDTLSTPKVIENPDIIIHHAKKTSFFKLANQAPQLTQLYQKVDEIVQREIALAPPR